MSQLQVTGEAKIRDIQGPVVANSGVITALDGAASQYVRGDGTLADFPTSTGGGSSVSYYLNSSVSQGTIGGVAYRQLGKTPIAGAGTDITISANGYVASYITDANDPALLEVPAGNFNCEFYFSVNSNNHNPYVYAEVYKYDGTTFTLIGSSQSVPEYLTNGTTLSPYYFAIPVTQTTLAITDRIAIRIYVNVDTKVVTLHTENNHLCQVVTTFSKGLTSLNNLTRQVQFLATGTSGTDFNIVSSVATHTFNLPDASPTARGLITTSTQNIAGSKTFNDAIGANYGIALYNGAIPPITSIYYAALSGNSTGLSITYRTGGGTNYTNNLNFPANNNSYAFPATGGTLALTSDLSAYLPLAGGTLTGILNISTASYLTSRLKLINTATGGNSWSLSSGNQNNSTNNSLFTIINETLSKNTFVLSPTGKLALGADLGTTNPSDDLAIFSTNTILKVVDLTGNNSNLNLQATNTAAYIRAGYTTTAIPLILQTGNIDILTIAANGQVTLSTNVITTGAQFVQNGFYLSNANGGSLAGYTHMWARNEGINFGLRNGTGGASFIFPSANSYNYTFPAASGTLALSSDLGAYLPLTGGTLTGALSGTSATFSGALGVNSTIRSTGQTDPSSGVGMELFYRAADTSSYIQSYDRTNGAWKDVRIYGNTLYFGTQGTNSLTINTSGNVGIGTSSPSDRFNVVVSTNGNNSRFDGPTSGLIFQTNATTTDIISYGGTTPAYRNLNFSASASTNMTITTGGNVGIGTSSPVAADTSSVTLQLRNTLILQNVVGNQGLFSNNAFYDAGAGTGWKRATTLGAAAMRMYELDGGQYGISFHIAPYGTAGSQITGWDTTDMKMRITSGGQLLVGATSTDSGCQFRFLYTGSSQNGLQLFDNTNTSGTIFHLFSINNGGNINIGSITRASSTNAVLFNTTSDYRLKEDFKEINGLDKVSQIKVYDFKWKGIEERMDGVIAHELQEVLPYAVHGIKDGEEMQGVDYSKIVPILVKAIQEQQGQIEELKAMIAAK